MGVISEPSQSDKSFNNYDMVLRSAIDEHGVALGWMGFMDAFLEQGSLVRATSDIVASNAGYIMSRDYSAPSRGPQLVFDWIASNIKNHEVL